MAEPARKTQLHSYDEDFSAWTEEQGRLLKAGSTVGLDWENLAEEIESLGKSQRREIRNRLKVLLQHLLKWHFQPGRRKIGWKASIMEARDRVKHELLDSPSLRTYPQTVLEKQYHVARFRAAAETRLPPETFPMQCPYSVTEILDEAFFPGEGH